MLTSSYSFGNGGHLLLVAILIARLKKVVRICNPRSYTHCEAAKGREDLQSTDRRYLLGGKIYDFGWVNSQDFYQRTKTPELWSWMVFFVDQSDSSAG